MSEIERYLGDLRSALEVDAKRADEIIAEVRSHLEARAAELEASGMNRDEAMGEAVRGFGEAGLVAGDLVRANSRHRRPQALRALGAVAVSLGAGFALAALYGSSESRNSLSVRIMMSITGLDWFNAGWLLMVIALIPAALLAGMVGGRRFWWLASAPALFWISFCSVLMVVYGSRWSAGQRDAVIYSFALPAGDAFVLAGIGWLGARLTKVRIMAYAAGSVCGLYVSWLAFGALWSALTSDAGSGVTAAVTQGVLLILFAATRRQSRRIRPALAAAFAALFVMGSLLVAVVAYIFLVEGARMTDFRMAFTWLLAALESLIGLVAVAAWLYRDHSRPASAAGPSPS